MQEKIMSFYDLTDGQWKYYSVHGSGLYYDNYQDALRDELIGLGIIKGENEINRCKCFVKNYEKQ